MGGIIVHSLAGANCTFLPPWAGAGAPVVTVEGVPIKLVKVTLDPEVAPPSSLWMFQTQRARVYSITAPSLVDQLDRNF